MCIIYIIMSTSNLKPNYNQTATFQPHEENHSSAIKIEASKTNRWLQVCKYINYNNILFTHAYLHYILYSLSGC